MIATDYDICERKSARSETSFHAHELIKGSKETKREQILAWAQGFGEFTLRDVCAAFDVQPNQISGRLSELKRLGRLKETGYRRDGCAILRVIGSGEQMRLFRVSGK
jgi:predicted HTH transcriptional regulator